MVEPLDPDTMAEGEAALAHSLANPVGPTESYGKWDEWAWAHAARLLAVARDHARLTDELAATIDNADREIARLTAALVAIRDDDLVDYPEVARAALAPDA